MIPSFYPQIILNPILCSSIASPKSCTEAVHQEHRARLNPAFFTCQSRKLG